MGWGTKSSNYPDVMVGCDPRDTHRLYLQYPKLIVEVAPESTERLDRTEKRMAYQTIAPLEEYFIISQDRVQVIALRRSNRWNPEAFTDPNQKVGFNSIGAPCPFR